MTAQRYSYLQYNTNYLQYFSLKNSLLIDNQLINLIMEKLLNNIKAIRKEKNVGQKVIAKILNVSQPYYSQIESGERTITYEHLLQIAKCLDMSVVDIITYPKIYVEKSTIDCAECKQKDLIINQLSEYNENLKQVIKQLKK